MDYMGQKPINWLKGVMGKSILSNSGQIVMNSFYKLSTIKEPVYQTTDEDGNDYFMAETSQVDGNDLVR